MGPQQPRSPQCHRARLPRRQPRTRRPRTRRPGPPGPTPPPPPRRRRTRAGRRARCRHVRARATLPGQPGRGPCREPGRGGRRHPSGCAGDVAGRQTTRPRAQPRGRSPPPPCHGRDRRRARDGARRHAARPRAARPFRSARNLRGHQQRRRPARRARTRRRRPPDCYRVRPRGPPTRRSQNGCAPRNLHRRRPPPGRRRRRRARDRLGRRHRPPPRSPLDAGGGPASGAFDATDGTRLYTAGHDGAVTAWNLTDPEQPQSVELFRVPPNQNADLPVVVLINSDGGRLLVGDPVLGPSYIWDVRSGALLGVVPGVPGGWSPDGSTVAIGRGAEVVLVDAATGAQQGQAITGFDFVVPVMAFSPDGQRLAASDSDGTVRVFDLATRQEATTLALHDDLALPQFLADGRLFTRSSRLAAITRLDATAIAPIAAPPRPLLGIGGANDLSASKPRTTRRGRRRRGRRRGGCRSGALIHAPSRARPPLLT